MTRILLLIIIPLMSVAQPSGKYIGSIPSIYPYSHYIKLDSSNNRFVSNVGINTASGMRCIIKGRYVKNGDTLSLFSNNLPKGGKPIVKTYYDSYIPQDSVKITMINYIKGYYCHGVIINGVRYYSRSNDDTISFLIPRTSELLGIMCYNYVGGYSPVKVRITGINSIVLYIVKSKLTPLYCVWYDRRIIARNGVLKMLVHDKEINGEDYEEIFNFYLAEE